MQEAGTSRRLRALAPPAAALFGGSAILSVATVLLILSRHPVPAGVTSLLAAAGLIGGSVVSAAHPDRPSAFLGGVLDRAFDSSILAPLAWVLRPGGSRVAVLCLVALGLSFMAAYERARAQSLRYRGSDSPVYLAVRVVLLPVALLTGWFEAFLWAFAVLAASAATVRVYNVVVQERSARLQARGTP